MLQNCDDRDKSEPPSQRCREYEHRHSIVGRPGADQLARLRCFLTLRHIASKSQSKQAQPYREVAAGTAPSGLMAGIALRVNA